MRQFSHFNQTPFVFFFFVLHLFPRFDHAGGVGQDVNVLVLVVLVDLGPRLEQGLHEQVQEGGNSDLEPRGGRNTRWVKSFRPPPPPLGGGAAQVQGGPVPHQLHRRWVHAAEHLEEDRDVCWVQGPLGQHGAERLAGTRVGSGGAQSESDLAGVVTSDSRENKPPRQLTSTTTTKALSTTDVSE